MREVTQLKVDDIASLDGRRPVSDEAVSRIAESIKLVGLRTPITVRLVDDFVDEDGVVVDGQPVLVTGAHRLAAVKSLGWDTVECFVFDGDDEIDAQLWEIAENLHRAELTAIERSEHLRDWSRLIEEKAKVSQLGTPGGSQPAEKGIRKAAKEFGLSKSSVHRAVNIATKLTPEAKALAIDYGMADNQSALERIVRADDQVAEVQHLEDLRVQREHEKARRKEQKANGSLSGPSPAGMASARERKVASNDSKRPYDWWSPDWVYVLSNLFKKSAFQDPIHVAAEVEANRLFDQKLVLEQAKLAHAWLGRLIEEMERQS